VPGQFGIAEKSFFGSSRVGGVERPEAEGTADTRPEGPREHSPGFTLGNPG
jgi:hypothetical protein